MTLPTRGNPPKAAEERLNTAISTDRLQIALHNQRYEYVLKNLPRLNSVLEIGTGEGNLSVLLAGRCGNYVGLEFDAGACRVAAERLFLAHPVVRGDARRLPFKPASFSGVVCLEVLEHLGDFRAGIRNIHQCLQKDGRAIISVPYSRHGGGSANNIYHIYEPGEAELVNTLALYFQEVQVLYQYFQESPLMKGARLLRLRSALGLQKIYQDLTQGEPQALARLAIGPKPFGMKLHLVIVAERPKSI